MTPRFASLLLAVPVAWALLRGCWPAPAAAQPPDAGPGFHHGWKGVGSCSGTGCHHDGAGAACRGAEYTRWAAADPHANGYLALLDPRSKLILRNLHPERYGGDWTQAVPETERLCLQCHALDDPAPERHPDLLADGVGCENCHGPAGGYLTTHFRRGWSSLPKEAKASQGLRDLSVGRLTGRARACVDCHVGNGPKGMEVNHDLIAAGHPRLRFEFAASMAHLPRHWDDRPERAALPDLEARNWAVGQVVAATAALELLAYRADPANRRPWPELAEADCRTCHHGLNAGAAGKPAGPQREEATSRGTWYWALTPLAGEAGQRYRAGLDELHQAMSKDAADRAAVARQARDLAGWLRTQAPAVQAQGQTPDGLRARLDEWAREFRQGGTPDQQRQRYQAFQAYLRALPELPPERAAEYQRVLAEMEAAMKDGVPPAP